MEKTGEKRPWKSQERFPLSHSFNNNKLDDRDHFQQNAKTSVASLRGLIGSSRNIDRHHSGMLIGFIGIPNLLDSGIRVEFLGIAMTESKQELVRGTLDMLILKVVALGPSHGYAIAQRLQQISKEFFQVHQGSLYPGLHRLEDKGWLQAEWKESETGRQAKFHSLTGKGRRHMEAEVVNWERLCDAVGLVLSAEEES